jgi:hypothetical protein
VNVNPRYIDAILQLLGLGHVTAGAKYEDGVASRLQEVLRAGARCLTEGLREMMAKD